MAPAVEAHSLNHWATREVPDFIYMLNENLPCNTSNHVLKRMANSVLQNISKVLSIQNDLLDA